MRVDSQTVLPGLRGRVAIVTGGTRGLGRSIVAALLRQGATVVSMSIDQGRAKALDRELDGSGRAVHGDIASVEDIDRVIQLAESEFGTPTLLVNDAGVITRESDLTQPLDSWQRVIDVNLTGPFLMSRAVIPGMVRVGGGAIVNITSQMAYLPHPGAAPSYEVSKAGLVALTRHQAMRHAADGVRVNSIAPGTIDTGLASDMDPGAFARILSGIPLGFMGTSADVAGAVLFLLSDAAKYITGASLGVNGGSLMR